MHEWCRVQRWRAKKSQEELARELGVTRPWVTYMENGQVPCDKLVQYWQKKST